MTSHFDLSDDLFEKLFQDCSLNPELFNHEAHLRIAWIHVTKYGVDKAIEHITSQLNTYVISLGAINKYNKTLTIASVKAINHFINKSGAATFREFIEEFPALKYNFREIIGAHYTSDIFNAEIAKQTYLEPDLLPFS